MLTLWRIHANKVRLCSEHDLLQYDGEAVDVSFLSSVDRSRLLYAVVQVLSTADYGSSETRLPASTQAFNRQHNLYNLTQHDKGSAIIGNFCSVSTKPCDHKWRYPSKLSSHQQQRWLAAPLPYV